MNTIHTHTLPFETASESGFVGGARELLEDPGFGRSSPTIWRPFALRRIAAGTMGESAPRQASPRDPATMVFHYASEIFEGLKAYRLPEEGRVVPARGERPALL